MTPKTEDIVLLSSLIKEGIQSPELMTYFGITRNQMDWWIKMTGGQKPLDLRKYTCHLKNDEVEAFRHWHRQTQATTLEIRQKYGIPTQGLAVLWLEELGLTVNKRRPKSAAAGGEAMKASRPLVFKPDGNTTAQRLSDKDFSKIVKVKMNPKPPEYQGSIADKFRAQGLATANPYR